MDDLTTNLEGSAEEGSEVPEREGYVSLPDAARAYWKAHPDRPLKIIASTISWRLRMGKLAGEQVQVGKSKRWYVRQEDVDNMKPLPPYQKSTRPDVTARRKARKGKKQVIDEFANEPSGFFPKREAPDALNQKLINVAELVRAGLATVVSLSIDVRIKG